jgi:hypothetical protein
MLVTMMCYTVLRGYWCPVHIERLQAASIEVFQEQKDRFDCLILNGSHNREQIEAILQLKPSQEFELEQVADKEKLPFLVPG